MCRFLISGLMFVLYAMGGTLALAEDSFSLAPPSNLQQLQKHSLWATQYYVHPARNATGAGSYPLLGKGRTVLGPSLSEEDWCRAALEGTVNVTGGSAPGVYNYLGKDPNNGFKQADCTKYFKQPWATALTRTLFVKVPADAPDGLGDKAYYRLVPFRTVAVDRAVFPAIVGGKRVHHVFYIPALRGKPFSGPNGETLQHDGYVLAADKGGAIKGNHIDVFTGRDGEPFAPDVVTSSPKQQFVAYEVTDPAIIASLAKLHVRN
jgi:3D (Asp-Asp-Asp) domain-containing protein